jgi:hypothetical protein
VGNIINAEPRERQHRSRRNPPHPKETCRR